MFSASLKGIAHFELPDSTREKFQALEAAMAARASSPAVRSAVAYVQEGLAAAHYHLANLELLENRFLALTLARLPQIELGKGEVLAISTTRRLDFEYQALAAAIRRALKYAAASLGAFFQCDVGGIRGLADDLRNQQPQETSNRIIARLEEALPRLEDLLPRPRGLRQQRSHAAPAPVGTLTITRDPTRILVGFAGGGESLRSWGAESHSPLAELEDGGAAILLVSPHLRDQLSRVERLIFGMYSDLGLIRDS